jgi:cell division septum initiation protein DivIVA
MPEGRSPISSARISTGDIARHSFAIVRRGFDIDEVKTYLQSVARSIEVLEQREQELREAVAEADERAAHPVVDEATLTASLGQHSAQILRHAHDEAAKIVVQAQEGASTLLREAQNQANEIQAQSEGASAERVAEAEIMVVNATKEAREAVERIRYDALAEADAVIARAKDEGRVLLEQVHEARKRVMADLAGRRRALSIQIEQLRAARDEMAASVQGVRGSIDGILAQLERSDDDARAAGLAAADQARLHLPKDLPEEETVHSVETGDDPAQGGVTPSVDELFARIRAGTDAARDEDEHGSGSGGKSGAPSGAASAGAESTNRGVTDSASVDDEDELEDEEEEGGEGPDQALVVRRDELLSPISSQLSRHIKRALGDDQNRLLDVLRSTPNVGGEALLGPEDLHLSTFTTAAQGHLADAFAAGTVFAGAPEGSIAAGPAVEQAAASLSRTVVSMLRRRIAEGTDAGDEVAERVGAAFREWRGERIERLVGDFAVQAFSAGVTAASLPGGQLRWVLTSRSGCSDCDDNALAGAVAIDDSFPTGHAYPPAHSGCRCMVVPITA